MKTLLVIPAHNEEEIIEKTLSEVNSISDICDYVVINDRSTDSTKDILVKLNANFLDLPVNLGLNDGVQTGFKYAYDNGYDCVIQYDSDGQHRPESVADLIESIKRGNDMAIGSRFINSSKKDAGMKGIKRLGSSWITFWIKLFSGMKINDPTSGLRAYNKKLIEKMKDDVNLRVEPDTVFVLAKCGYKIEEIQANIVMERQTGESYLNKWKSISYMFYTTANIFLMIFKKV